MANVLSIHRLSLCALVFSLSSCSYDNENQGSTASSGSHIREKPVEIADDFLALLPIPSVAEVGLGSEKVWVHLIGAGNTGPAFKVVGQDRVLKLVYQAPADETLSSKQEQALIDAEELFRFEQNLLFDFKSMASTDPSLLELTRFFVAAEKIEITYKGQTYSAIEKEYVRGQTIAGLSANLSSFRAAPFIVRSYLSKLYRAQKNAVESGYYVHDFNDENVLYVEGRNPPILVIDGAYSGYFDNRVPYILFEEECMRITWCRFYMEFERAPPF